MRLILTLMFFVSAPVLAADDFGARFVGEAPSAFGDPEEGSSANSLSMDEAAEILQDILPAAGEEENVAEEGVEQIEKNISDQ